MAALLHARAVHARGLCATPSPSARAGPIINDVRHALFDRLEHELDWSGVDETLQNAVSTSVAASRRRRVLIAAATDCSKALRTSEKVVMVPENCVFWRGIQRLCVAARIAA